MELLVGIIWAIGWGVVCRGIASLRGRSPGVAFLLGVLFGPISAVVYALSHRVSSGQGDTSSECAVGRDGHIEKQSIVRFSKRSRAKPGVGHFIAGVFGTVIFGWLASQDVDGDSDSGLIKLVLWVFCVFFGIGGVIMLFNREERFICSICGEGHLREPDTCRKCGARAGEIYDPRARDGGYRKCPFCAEYVRSDARICRYCNRSL